MIPALLLWAGCSPRLDGQEAARKPAPASAPRLAKSTPWTAGSEVPGWPDAACDPGLTVARYRFDNPTNWRMVGEIADVAGRPRPARIYIETRDCASFPCDTTLPRDPSTPYLAALLTLTTDDGFPDATGWWGPDTTTVRGVRGSGYAVFGRAADYARDGHGNNAEVSVCLSRVRPDSVTGVLFFRLPVPGDPVMFWAVDAVEFWAPFTFTLPEHAGTSWPADAETGGPEGNSNTMEWRYVGVSYDDAWPWATITDASVHDAMYAAYTPSDAP